MVDLDQEEKDLQSQMKALLEKKSGGEQPPQQVNLAMLADEIFRILKRDLEIEADRSGHSL